MDTDFPRILHAGESCVVVEFGSGIDPKVNARVQALRKRIEKDPFNGLEVEIGRASCRERV